MSNVKLAKEWLSACTAGTAPYCVEGTGLVAIHQKIFGHRKNVLKDDAVRDLSEFYGNDQNILDIHNGLHNAEKAFVSAVARNNGNEYLPVTQMLAKEYGLESEQKRTWGYAYQPRQELSFLDLIKRKWPDTRAMLLFPGGKAMPGFVVEAIREVKVPLQRPYAPFAPGPNDLAICREERIGDFAALVRFAGSEALKVADGTFDITKAKMARMVGAMAFPEVCDGGGKFVTPKEASRINDFKVAMPMFALAATVGLFDIAMDGTLKPSQKAVELLSSPPHVFAKKLYDSYYAKNKIRESHYVTYLAVRDGESCVDWEFVRRPVIGMLEGCPPGEWVDIDDFKRNLILSKGNFFRRVLNTAVFLQGPKLYGRGGDPKWEECEGPLVETILSFLGAMGVLDIAYTEHVRRFLPDSDYWFDKESPDRTGIAFRLGISGFRITRLGAWILGMGEDEYVPQNPQAMQETGGGLAVQPDYNVVISGMESRVTHEPYLSSFLSRVSVDDNVAIYKIDFESMVRAYRLGITPKEISKYLSNASTWPLADNVLRSFDTWQAKVGKVRIRTVTLIETDDPVLLSELAHTKGIDRFLGKEISNAMVISEPGEAGSIRTAAEKSGWLVDLEGEFKKPRKSAGKQGKKK